jgi:2-polyprenyl-3-methyl-5-hydroxy-6-metoxy-1,4-benzoquinol methylase
MISSPASSVDRATWEQAEVARSQIEATATRAASLRLREKNARRYLNPPADTCYPLEYAYYLLGEVHGRRVLDLGCGSGMNSTLLARRGAQVTGIDISAALLALAAERAAENRVDHLTRFAATSAHDLPFPGGSFDVVFGIAILHHLDLPLVARETRRVLKPGGRAIFQEPMRNSALIRVLRPLIPYRAPDVSPLERPLVNAEIDQFRSGFSWGRSRDFSLPHVNLAQVLPGMQRYIHPMYRWDGMLLRRFPRLAHLASVRVFEVLK